MSAERKWTPEPLFYFVVRDPRTGLEHWELDSGQPPPQNTARRESVTRAEIDCE